MKRVLRFIWKLIKWLLITVISLFLLIAIVVHLPPVQSFLLRKGTTYFNDKTDGDLSIGDMDLRLPFYLQLEGIVLNDPQGEKIASIGDIEIGIGWRKIFFQTISLDDIQLADVDATLSADQTGKWNYQFIIDGFSSGDSQPADTSSSSSWDISVSQIRLKNIQFNYENGQSGDTLQTDIGRFYTNFQRASVLNQVFLVDKIELNHTGSYFSMGERSEMETTENEEDESESELTLSLNSLSIEDVESYTNIPGAGIFDVNVGELEVKVKKFNLDLNQYLIDQIQLKNSRADIQLPESEAEETNEPTSIFPDVIVELKQASLSQNRVHLKLGNDSLEHDLNIEDLSARKLAVDSSQYAVELDNLSLRYNDFPELKELSAGLLLTDSEARVDHFKLSTENSTLNFDLLAEYSSFEKALNEYLFNQASLNLKSLKLGKSDLNNFKAKYIEDDSLPDFESDVIINALLKSKGQNIYLSPLEIEYGRSLLSTEIEKYSLDFAEYDGEIKSFFFELGSPLRDHLSQLIGSETVAIPEVFELSLEGQTFADSARVNARLHSSAGDITLKGESNLSDTALIPMHAEINSAGFSIGNILTSSPEAYLKFNLDAFSANILQYDSLSQATLQIDTIFYEIPLKDIKTDISINNALYKADLAVRDTFLDADLLTELKFSDTLQTLANLTINGVDLQGLGFIRNDIRGKTKIYASYNQAETFQTGELEVSEVSIVKENENFDLEPLLARFYFDEDTTDLEITGLLNAHSRSNMSFEKILDKLPSIINQAYKQDQDTTSVWEAEVDIGEMPIVREVFLPELTRFSGLSGQIDYQSSKGQISAELDLPELVYSDFFIDSLKLSTGSDSTVISRTLDIKMLGYDTLTVSNFTVLSYESEDQTDIRIQTQRNLNASPDYLINFRLKLDTVNNNISVFSLEDTLLLNNDVWSITENQFYIEDSVSYGKVSISLSNQKLSFNKEKDLEEFTIDAENFELVNLLSITQADSLVSGTFSGNFTSTPNSFKGKGHIDNFAVLHGELGDLSWDLKQEENTKLKISCDNGRLNFTSEGEIASSENAPTQFSVNTNLRKLDLKLASELYPSYILDAKGELTGNLDLSGTSEDPKLNGTFQFENAEISTVYTGDNLKIEKSRIDLSTEKINLNTISLRDSAGSLLTIKGEINNYLEDIARVNIAINTKDFTLVDVSPEDGVLVYGKLKADLDINVTERLDAPKVRAKLKIADGTDFTYKVQPDNDYETFDDDLIEWTNLDTTSLSKNEILTREKEKLNSKVDVFANTVDFNGEVQIVEEATLRVLIDSAAGDYLEIRGDAKISMDYNRAGNLRMIGNYYVADGFYQMNFYNISKKKFKLKEGGYVNWNGDAFNPTLNLSAVYTTRATLTNLMMTESNSTVNPAYQQSLPFNVIMSIEGEVEDPEIAFDIRLDEENRGALNGAVDSRLSILRREESEMNKQVFALLVFQTFMPAGSTSNPNLIENQARSSASQILSQELNKYSDQLIQGVDVNFDLQSYGGAQGQGNTDLTVDVAKSFFDNRVVVRVGSTIALEQNINTGNNDPFNTNVVVEYLITKDGRYRFLGYSKTNLEDIVVGRITRTGVGLLYQRDFDRFRYLLNPKSRPENIKADGEKDKAELEEKAEDDAQQGEIDK